MEGSTDQWFTNDTIGRNDGIDTTDIGQIIMFITSIVVGTLGILGNGLVILICICYPFQGITNIVVCNQSLIDFTTSMIFLLQYTLPDYRYDLPSSSPIAASLLCGVWVSRYPFWALSVSSTVNLEYITIERYMAVFYPFQHRVKFTKYRAKLCAIIPWVYGLLHELPWALTHKEREPGVCSSQWQSDGLRFAVGIIAPTDHYVIPLVIICFVYIRIVFKLRESDCLDGGNTPTTTSGNSSSDAREIKIKRASRNIIKTMFVVSITYLICWGPNEFLYLYSNLGGKVDFSDAFNYYTVVSATCNMCVNPIIYLCNWKDFRAKTLKLSKRIVPCCEDVEKTAQVHTVHIVSSNGL